MGTSCIPLGQYTTRIKWSNKLGRVFEVQEVPNRTNILVHIGNTTKDTYGCILPGRYRDYSQVRQSGLALGDILQELPDEFELDITGII